MGMLLALAVPALLMLLPLRLSLHLTRAAGTQGSLGVMLGPLRLTLPFRVARDARGGHRLIFLPRRPRAKSRPASPAGMQRGMAMLGAFLRADRARRLLMGHIRLLDLTAQVRLSLSDAASTAVVTGLLRAMTAILPAGMQGRTHLSLQPDFLAPRTSVRLRCMISLRLGILLITGGMALSAWLQEKREHAPSGKEA